MIRPRRAVPVILVAAVGFGAGATTAIAKTVKITVGDDFFSPSRKSVKKGTKLKFVWNGENTHNVKATGAAKKTGAAKTTGAAKKTARKATASKATAKKAAQSR